MSRPWVAYVPKGRHIARYVGKAYYDCVKKIDAAYEILLQARQFIRMPSAEQVEAVVDKTAEFGKILIDVKSRIAKIRRFALEDNE